MKILFLDIDGVVLPGRAYMLPDQTKPIVKIFDPCAVSLVNAACERTERKIVLHSSWIRTGLWKIGEDGPYDVHDHLVNQGIDPKHLYRNPYCNRDISYRYDRIAEWVTDHPEVDDFVILDDVDIENDEHRWLKKHLILTDFDEGLTLKNFYQLLEGDWRK